jgi:hypothetical protein
MSTDRFPAVPFENWHYRQPDLNMASYMTNHYGAQDGWNMCPPHTEARMAKVNCSGYPLPFTAMPINTGTAERVDSMVYSTPSGFKMSTDMAHNQDAPTVSPSQTHFDSSDTSSQFYGDSTLDLPNAPQSTHLVDDHRVPLHQGSNSSQTSHDSYSPTYGQRGAGRKRKSECLEPGSARATYLEKNRKAASKCRNKQKRQQEDLVEETRIAETKNKLLKAEVEMLRGDMRELMQIVDLHSNCTDSRLKCYVQREADRLATGSMLWAPVSCLGNTQPATIPRHGRE